MAKVFHVRAKDMTPEERKAYKLHNEKHGLMAKINKNKKEIAELREQMLEDSDPEYAALKKELEKLEKRSDELKLELRKKQYDAMPEKAKRMYDKIGANPYKDQLAHRSTGVFMKTESYIKEDR